MNCTQCKTPVPLTRWNLGYKTCLNCGEQAAKQARTAWCVAQEYSKGNYQLITNPDSLKQTNPKRTT